MKQKETFTGGSWLGPRDREYQRILPRSSDRKSSRSRRNRRRDKSSESLESKKSHSPVVITTISRNKSGLGDRAGGSGDTASGAAAGVGRSSSQGIRTIAQQRSSSQRGGGGGGESVAETPKSKTTSLPNPNFSGERGAGGEGYRASSPHLTISAVEMPASGTSEEEEDDSDLTDGVHISPSGGSADHRSETSSIVTRVYAPSSCTEDQVAFSRAGTSWVVEVSIYIHQFCFLRFRWCLYLYLCLCFRLLINLVIVEILPRSRDRLDLVTVAQGPVFRFGHDRCFYSVRFGNLIRSR